MNQDSSGRHGGVATIAIASMMAGIESYDLSIYGLFSVAIAQVFFPNRDPTSSLLAAVATLGVGYVARPIGGLVLGAYADRIGRKPAIILTVVLMALSTGCIGLVPGYATVGAMAPVLVVIARLLQGFSAGGAIPNGVTYLTESAPPARRGFFGSWQQTGQVGAFLFSAVVGAVVANSFSPHTVNAWAWRIPFLFALVLGPIGLLARRFLKEPETFAKAQAQAHTDPPVAKAVGANLKPILAGLGLSCLWNISAFVILFYMPTYAQRELAMTPGQAFLSAVVCAAVLFCCCPLFGLLCDRVGRRLPMFIGAALLAVTAYPLFALMHSHPDLPHVLFVQVLLAVMVAAYTAPVPALLAELYPMRTRSTALSVAYNLSILLLGAFGPFIVTWLIVAMHNPLAPALYIAGGSVVSAMTVLSVRDRTGQVLDPVDAV